MVNSVFSTFLCAHFLNLQTLQRLAIDNDSSHYVFTAVIVDTVSRGQFSPTFYFTHASVGTLQEPIFTLRENETETTKANLEIS